MIRTRTLLLVLVGCDLLLLALHLLLSGHPYLGTVFDLDQEGNVPTWFSSLQLAMASAAAVFCWTAESRAPAANRRSFRSGWLAVAALLLGMSLDETGQIHEALTGWLLAGDAGRNLRAAFGASEQSGSMLWGLLFSPVLVVVAVACFLFYARRMRAGLLACWAAAIALLALSLVLETKEASVLGVRGFLSEGRWETYRGMIAVEEVLELLAETILVAVHYEQGRRTLSEVGR